MHKEKRQHKVHEELKKTVIPRHGIDWMAEGIYCGILCVFNTERKGARRNTESFDADYAEAKMKRPRRDNKDCITLLCELCDYFVFFVVNLPMF